MGMSTWIIVSWWQQLENMKKWASIYTVDLTFLFWSKNNSCKLIIVVGDFFLELEDVSRFFSLPLR